ncbi:MAG: hypothetical protein J7647_20680 [Cyanobacteria bacterium SBLK]|nr:hypothetical protein [Cyanobacteria bacterium SBLK]
MNQSQLRRDRVSRSRRLILVSLSALLWLYSSQPAFAHSGHSHQRKTPTPSSTPEISPTDMDEEMREYPDRPATESSVSTNEEILPASTSIREIAPLADNPRDSTPKTEPIPLLGEGLLAWLFIAPIILMWLKRNYHQSRSKK